MKQFNKTACAVEQRLSKKTLLAFFPEDTGTGKFLHSLDPNAWEIISFTPLDRNVCIRLTADSGVRIISLVLPVVSTSGIRD
jgi:hypothetical protein